MGKGIIKMGAVSPISQLLTDLEKMNDRAGNIPDNITNLLSIVRENQEDLDSLQKSFQQKSLATKQEKAEILRLKNQITELQNRVHQILNDRAGNIPDNITNLLSIVRENQKDLDSLQKSFQQKNSATKQEKAEISRLKNQITALQNQVNQILISKANESEDLKNEILSEIKQLIKSSQEPVQKKWNVKKENHGSILFNQGKSTPTSSSTKKSFIVDLGSGVKLEMVYIPAGTFMMGSQAKEEGSCQFEYPQHRVTLKAFYMAKYPITQAQYKAIMGKNPSHFNGNDLPVDSVSWDMAQKFCQKLSQKMGRKYQLPSEAQWEYACRAGTTTPFYFGETISDELANYNATFIYGNGKQGKYLEQTNVVGSFPPNSFGLYDMHGNVWECCADTWHDNYKNAPTDGSAWVNEFSPNTFVVRGGSWDNVPNSCRSAFRCGAMIITADKMNGFRIMCDVGNG